MYNRTRSILTQKVNILLPPNTNEYAVFQTITSGQLPFLGSRSPPSRWSAGSAENAPLRSWFRRRAHDLRQRVGEFGCGLGRGIVQL